MNTVTNTKLEDALGVIESWRTDLHAGKLVPGPTSVILKSYDAIAFALKESSPAPLPPTESQVVKFMDDFMRANNLNHFSIQSDRENGKLKYSHSFYCSNPGKSGMSPKSAESALANMKPWRVGK